MITQKNYVDHLIWKSEFVAINYLFPEEGAYQQESEQTDEAVVPPAA